jgi:diketogulonate reductase-like aldo/keto reductase
MILEETYTLSNGINWDQYSQEKGMLVEAYSPVGQGELLKSMERIRDYGEASIFPVYQ